MRLERMAKQRDGGSALQGDDMKSISYEIH